MKKVIHLENSRAFLAAVAMACFGLLPEARAVVPAPDGGYPGGNTAEGQNALFSLTTGGFNTAVGYLSLRSDTVGSFNTALGAGALLLNTGQDNTAVGAAALLNNTTSSFNTAIGFRALFNNISGGQNAAVGNSALANNTSGAANTAIGDSALFNNDTGFSNTALGFAAGFGVGEAHDVICIGANVSGANLNNSCFIGNIYGANEGGTILPVYINSSGRLGTQPPSSSRRFKTEINRMDRASEAIRALRPVTFRYKHDTTATPQFGLIAEEVAELNPDLVIYDADGKPYTVRYDAVNAMLLNEFLKQYHAFTEERRKVEKLESTVARLVETMKGQASQIQKVSARIETSSSAPQVARANQTKRMSPP